MPEMRETIHSRLQMIASLLGVPVQDLISGTVPRRLWADNECMRLWRGLRTEAGRAGIRRCSEKWEALSPP